MGEGLTDDQANPEEMRSDEERAAIKTEGEQPAEIIRPLGEFIGRILTDRFERELIIDFEDHEESFRFHDSMGRNARKVSYSEGMIHTIAREAVRALESVQIDKIESVKAYLRVSFFDKQSQEYVQNYEPFLDIKYQSGKNEYIQLPKHNI